ncbi:hypothetical protein SB659_03990 [Arthrobacter sp. SIMBA_036]|uniref:hypothetical protein n=1 Tax=Arthrobacter sp. SIMBA_036 TaxID=3085778 RepID=UPI00397C67E8
MSPISGSFPAARRHPGDRITLRLAQEPLARNGQRTLDDGGGRVRCAFGAGSAGPAPFGSPETGPGENAVPHCLDSQIVVLAGTPQLSSPGPGKGA